MSKKEGGSSLFGILRIALPLALGVMVVVFLFFPDTFQSANDSVRKILPSTNGLEKGMLRYEELEQSKIYTSLAEALQNPNEVRVLNLSKQRITEIPASIAKLKNLQFLELQDNNIEYIAKEIGSLPLLQELYLGKNRLTTLPPEMGNLKNLRVLDLSMPTALISSTACCTPLRIGIPKSAEPPVKGPIMPIFSVLPGAGAAAAAGDAAEDGAGAVLCAAAAVAISAAMASAASRRKTGNVPNLKGVQIMLKVPPGQG